MNQVLVMAFKDLRLLFRDKLGAFFIIGFPILMGLFFGMVMGGPSTGSSQSKMKIVMVDLDQSEISGEFVRIMAAHESIALSESSFDAARESVRKGQRVAMLVLEKGFGESAGVFWNQPPTIQVGVDPSRAAESAMLQGMVMEGIGELAGQRMTDLSSMNDMIARSRDDLAADESISVGNRLLLNTFFISLENMQKSVDALQTDSDESSAGSVAAGGFEFARIESIDVSRKIDPKSQAGQMQQLKSKWDISFPQAMMWGVLACVAGFAISIARERTQGTMMRLQIAPITRSQILMGKALACFLSVMLVVAFMIGLGMFLGMRPGNYLMLTIAALCVATCFTGIMMIMSNLGKTEQSVNGAGWAISMVMAMIGGAMIPVMFMPQFMQKLSYLSPIKWAILAVEGAVWREFSVAEMMLPCGILLAIGVVGMAVGTAILTRE
ncbi:MAG: ABC transporter permease [Pirellulaceae bacterium]|nr:ABC transporter permease [Pirellulaceae bacterium]